MDDTIDFRRATRRVLFTDKEITSSIPGGGKSAAASPDRHLRTKITINVDSDILTFFKDWAQRDGRPYQSLINQTLREYIDGTRPEQLAQTIKQLLLTDEKFLREVSAGLKSSDEE